MISQQEMLQRAWPFLKPKHSLPHGIHNSSIHHHPKVICYFNYQTTVREVKYGLSLYLTVQGILCSHIMQFSHCLFGFGLSLFVCFIFGFFLTGTNLHLLTTRMKDPVRTFNARINSIAEAILFVYLITDLFLRGQETQKREDIWHVRNKITCATILFQFLFCSSEQLLVNKKLKH